MYGHLSGDPYLWPIISRISGTRLQSTEKEGKRESRKFLKFFLRVEKCSCLKDFLSWVLTYWTRDITCSRTRHIRLQLRLIPKDSIKIFIYHITRADFYLNARTNFYNMSEIPILYKGLKLDSFRLKSRQCVRSHAKILIRPYTDFPKNSDFWTKITRNCSGSMWKLRFDLSGTHRKYVYGHWRNIVEMNFSFQ